MGGWVHVSLEIVFLENCPKIIPYWQWYIAVSYHVYCVCITLLKCASHYDLSVLFMSVMGFKENWTGSGWVRWAVSICFCFLENVTLQSPLAFYWRYVNDYAKRWMKSSTTVCRRRRRDRRLRRWRKTMLCWRVRRSLSAEDRSHDESLQHCIARLSYAVLSSLSTETNKRCYVLSSYTPNTSFYG